MASTAKPSDPMPVTITTEGPRARMSGRRSRPLMPGSRWSSRTRSTPSRDASASSALPAVRTSISRTATCGLVDPDVAAHALDEGAADEEAESDADAALVQAHELVEHPCSLIRRDAGPLVADRQTHIVAVTDDVELYGRSGGGEFGG